MRKSFLKNSLKDECRSFFFIIAAIAVIGLCCGSCRLCREEDPRTADGNPIIQLEVWTIALKPKFTGYMEKLFADFEHAHRNIKIVWTDLPQQNIMTKLMASVAGDVPPDLVNLTTANAVFLAGHSSLASVSELDRDRRSKEYFPNIWNAAAYKGEIYAVPWYVSTRVLIFNRNLLKEAGFAAPPADRAGVYALAEKMRETNKAHWGFFPVIRLLDDFGMLNVRLYEPSTKKAAFVTPEAVGLLNWYAELYSKDLVPKEVLSEGYQGALERYKQGTLALLEAGPQVLLQIKSDAPEVYSHTDVAPLPWSQEGTVPAAVMNFVIPRSGRHKEEAAELAFFITNWQNQLAFDREVPLLPSTLKTAEDAFFAEGRGEQLLDKAMSISLKQLVKAHDFSLGIARSRELERCLKEAAETVIYGQSSAETGLQSAAEAWNEIVSGAAADE
ncbi:extracellular solute-binding protein [bacterium]|nr:extracellular solute-binding protein [bacterium]